MSWPQQPSTLRLRCRLGIHRYVLRHDQESGQRFRDCLYCARLDHAGDLGRDAGYAFP